MSQRLLANGITRAVSGKETKHVAEGVGMGWGGVGWSKQRLGRGKADEAGIFNILADR